MQKSRVQRTIWSWNYSLGSSLPSTVSKVLRCWVQMPWKRVQREKNGTSWLRKSKWKSLSHVSDSLWLHRLGPARLLCPWDSPGQNTGVDWHFLLQNNVNILENTVSLSWKSRGGTASSNLLVTWLILSTTSSHPWAESKSPLPLSVFKNLRARSQISSHCSYHSGNPKSLGSSQPGSMNEDQVYMRHLNNQVCIFLTNHTPVITEYW